MSAVVSFILLLIPLVAWGAEDGLFELRMPGILPYADLYACHAVKLNEENEVSVTGFTPHSSMNVAHHILIYGCATPGSEDEFWNCGEMNHGSEGSEQKFQKAPVCQTGPNIIYAWARDAPELTLPKDVGFKVGGHSPIKYLVIQVHYMHPMKDKDYSGVTLHFSPQLLPKEAAVMLMVTGGMIKKHSNENFETACLIDESVEMHPFAFRTHAHKRAKLVSGYSINPSGKWHLIGKKDPMLPEMFYPVDDPNLVIKKGDTVAARCTMVNNEDRDIYIGSTGDDEMCNFYVMYWVDGDRKLSDSNCFSPGPPNYYWGRDGGLTNIPEDASRP